jgi:hypothetical protein
MCTYNEVMIRAYWGRACARIMKYCDATKFNYRGTYIKPLDEGELMKQCSYDVITLTANGLQIKL